MASKNNNRRSTADWQAIFNDFFEKWFTNRSHSGKSSHTNPYLEGTEDRNSAGSYFDNPNGDYFTSLFGQNGAGTSSSDSSLRWNEILARFGNNSDFTQLINAFGINGPFGHIGSSEANDWNKQLLETMLNYYLTMEQRNYNEGIRDEQRVYDSPTNQLARLMGAGISRDAALQLLGGAAGSGAAAGSLIGQPGVMPAGLASSESKLNDTNRKLGIANTVFNGVQTVASLMGAGVNIAQAIPQVQMLQAQNYMSQKQLSAFESVNRVSGALNDAISSGAASYEDLNNVTSAQEFLNNNKDNPNFAPLFANGDYQNTFGSTLGLGMMKNHWDNVLQSRHAGDLFDKYIKQQDLQNDLAEIGTATGRRDYYIGLAKGLNDLIMQDEQIALLWQQYQNGEIQIKINGQILKQEQYRTKSAKMSLDTQQEYFDAFQDALNQDGELLEQDAAFGGTGRDFLHYNAYCDLLRMYQNDVATSSSEKTTYTNADGVTVTGTRRQKYGDFFKANTDAAVTGAFIYDVVNSGRLNSWSGDASGFYRFCDMWRNSGASDVVNSVSAGANQTAHTVQGFVHPASKFKK